MNQKQTEKFADFLLPNGELKNREELKELMKDKTTEETKKYLPLNQNQEY